MTAAPLDGAVTIIDTGKGSGRRRAGLWGLRIAVAFVVVTFLISMLAPLLPLADPIDQHLADRFASPSTTHLLGTDSFGRDVLSRLIWGGRAAYEGVAISIGLALVVGVLWGLAAGWGPRALGAVLMRLVDTVLAFPALVLAIVVAGVLGPNLVNSMVSVGVVFVPVIARLTRVCVLEVREKGFIESARLSGCPRRVIVVRHVLPHVLGPVIVQLTLFAGIAFIVEGGLSFLGFGLQQPEPSWGGDLATAYESILSSPGQIIPPGVLIALVVLSVYRIGDAIGERLERGGTTAARSDSAAVTA